MEELVSQVASQVGISPEQARHAVNVVVDFLRSKLPGPIGDQIAAVVNTGQPRGPRLPGVGGLGGLFGR